MATVNTPLSVWLAIFAAVSYVGYTVVRRRYFHPLSHVPGPFLWSVSGLPLFYQQAILEGQLMHVLPELHAIYGMSCTDQRRREPTHSLRT